MPPAARQRTRWPRWLVVFLVVMALLVGGAFYAAHKTVNYYVITPGDATPVSQYIEVPPAYRHHETGTILLTDVFVTSLNALNYLRYKYLDSNNQIVPGSELLGPTVDPQQYLDQGYLEMAQAQDNATVTALRHLGYVVTSTPSGALVYGIEPGTPADRTLQVGQVITGVNGAATPSGCALVRALHGLSPGTTVALSVQQNTISDTGRVVPGPVVDKQVRLAKPPRGVTGGTCGISAPPTAFLGIDPEDQLDWHFPVHVTVHTADIGGPSAGLAMALGIMDELSTGRLTGHRIVAATGEIDPDGNVLDVGGVAEKTIAVEQAGATVFFVPKVEYQTAESKATPQLHVYGVDNINQVLQILERLGGSLPSKPL